MIKYIFLCVQSKLEGQIYSGQSTTTFEVLMLALKVSR